VYSFAFCLLQSGESNMQYTRQQHAHAIGLLVSLLVVSFTHQLTSVAAYTTRAIWRQRQKPGSTYSVRKASDRNNDDAAEEWSDFDGIIIGDAGANSVGETDAAFDFSVFQKRTKLTDLSACTSRQFSLGADLILSDFVGKMGFDEVTDWEYFYRNEDDPSDRKVVMPNPMSSEQPRRTRTSSGSVVRLFRGEFTGLLGGTLSAQGKDKRVLVKEFTGDLALQLATAELQAVGKLQSDLLAQSGDNEASNGDWIQTANTRSLNSRKDASNVSKLVGWLSKAQYTGILGQVDLAELHGKMTPNDFYRALGVPPPGPNAVWIVYEYSGLTTFQAYSEPAQLRRSRLPPKKGFFGNTIEPPALPPFEARANYVVNGIMKGAILALASVHESGLVHRSIGRSSLIMTSTSMDKREVASPYATSISQLLVKLSDFGFASLQSKSTEDDGFIARARSFGISLRKGENSIASTNFALAEDMHALSFVFLGLLLSSLAELPASNYTMPNTDEDTIQRLIGDIFDKDIRRFREYVEDEEFWTKLVDLLDLNEGAGWQVLEKLLLAREQAARIKDGELIFTVRGILASPFFSE
jgi:serine/threonine protein kinase